uniref:flavin reductase family protein n=1 Tax=Acetatifactor sp. TaxID=1872090 RepID=UPI0040564131
MKRKINVMDYATEIMQALSKGVLLTGKSGDRVNSMTISWGMLGVEWGKPIFITVVRESRYTRELLEQNPEFTINLPIGDYDKQITAVCGSKSGRDVDKVKELGLTLEDSEIVSVPGIKELPLTLECKVVYKQLQGPENMSEEMQKKHYPQDVPSDYCLANRDFHTAYYGEIVNAYIIE